MSNLSAKIEAILFYKREPQTTKELAEACDVKLSLVEEAVRELKDNLKQRGLTMIRGENNTLELAVDPEFSELISAIHKQEINSDLTRPQSEALAVIAYLAPTSKPEIDFIRGVNSRAVLRNLSIRGLIKKKGKRPIRYNLTHDALAHLGIESPNDLPNYNETKSSLQEFLEGAEEENEEIL